MTTDRAEARREGRARALALADWAGLLGVVASASDASGPQENELARLGAAIRLDALAGARAFTDAGDLDRADAMQLASDLGALIVRIAPMVEKLTARDLDVLAVLIGKASTEARTAGAMAFAA